MVLVAGVDSSTQSCKVVVVEAETGLVVRQGIAGHPDGTEVDPRHWWSALQEAVVAAGGLVDVAALSVAGQQHGMVCLDEFGEVVRPALLWNDTRSAGAAADLVDEFGAESWAKGVGSVPVASYTVTKLRWLADREPDSAARVAAIALPHDWLTWKLSGSDSLNDLVTDRSDASGTGYWSPATGQYRRDLLELALRRPASEVVLPTVLGPGDRAGQGDAAAGLGHLVLGPGCGDNAGAALGLGLTQGDVSISVGTSGVVAAVAAMPSEDATGTVSGFADATGGFLPLACTLNGSRVLDSAARLLGVDHDGLSQLALQAAPASGGLTYIPYLEGERTPNLPEARGSLHGMSVSSFTRENLARAAVEGVLCLLAECLDAVTGGAPVSEVSLIGGAARSRALCQLASSVLGGVAVRVPEPAEYVARGAARQAAWALSGRDGPPEWGVADEQRYAQAPRPQVREQFRKAAASYAAGS